ncbi:hemolysin family protein [Paenibacillus solisilvae]|uniref:Hemolysin family protein n=1 Tax=Paenibacillus solisilvae TaxID=2486751 RepID=A0ABW0VWG8_9BACL
MEIVLVLFFVACTAFFVAAEYAVIRSRMSRIEQLTSEGNKKAAAVKGIMTRLDEYLSACQLGNTLTNLALGWLGESTIEHLLQPLFNLIPIAESLETVLSFLIAFLLLTFLEVVIGELVPKIIAIEVAEPLAMMLARPLILFFKITYPFSWILNRSARFVTRMFGIQGKSMHDSGTTEAELRLILSEGYKSGIINPSEFRYVMNIFEMDDVIVKGIMLPRRNVAFISQESTIEQFITLTKDKSFDLYPVTEGGDKDHVVGLVRIKEVLTDYIHQGKDLQQSIKPYIRPVLQVLDTMSAQDIMLMMQKEHIQLAILLDEFGGTSGLVTIKDIIRTIVGSERDLAEGNHLPKVDKISEGHYKLSAKLLLKDVNRILKTELEEEGIYTIGGWLLSRKYDLHEHDRIQEQGYEFEIIEMQQHRVNWIEVVRAESV